MTFYVDIQGEVDVHWLVVWCAHAVPAMHDDNAIKLLLDKITNQNQSKRYKHKHNVSNKIT